MAQLTAFAAGLLFAAGLGVAGMTQPAKVFGFLDITGNWDPSLAFVMLGAIAVHATAVRGSSGDGRRCSQSASRCRPGATSMPDS